MQADVRLESGVVEGEFILQWPPTKSTTAVQTKIQHSCVSAWKKWSGRMDLNHRPPGPEKRVQNPHVVDTVSLTDQTASSRLRILHPILHPSLVPSVLSDSAEIAASLAGAPTADFDRWRKTTDNGWQKIVGPNINKDSDDTARGTSGTDCTGGSLPGSPKSKTAKPLLRKARLDVAARTADASREVVQCWLLSDSQLPGLARGLTI